MSFRSEAKPLDRPKKIIMPGNLMVTRDTAWIIVMATERETTGGFAGVVIYSHIPTAGHTEGEYSKRWSSDQFAFYNGIVTLTQD